MALSPPSGASCPQVGRFVGGPATASRRAQQQESTRQFDEAVYRRKGGEEEAMARRALRHLSEADLAAVNVQLLHDGLADTPTCGHFGLRL